MQLYACELNYAFWEILRAFHMLPDVQPTVETAYRQDQYSRLHLGVSLYTCQLKMCHYCGPENHIWEYQGTDLTQQDYMG